MDMTKLNYDSRLTFDELETLEPLLRDLRVVMERDYYRLDPNSCPLTRWYHCYRPVFLGLIGHRRGNPPRQLVDATLVEDPHEIYRILDAAETRGGSWSSVVECLLGDSPAYDVVRRKLHEEVLALCLPSCTCKWDRYDEERRVSMIPPVIECARCRRRCFQLPSEHDIRLCQKCAWEAGWRWW